MLPELSFRPGPALVRHRVWPGLLLLGLILAAWPGLAWAETTPLAMTHVTVLDGTGGAAGPDSTVLIQGDRITSVSPAAPPEGARVIDGRGKFLIPGLCDMHVHLAGVAADPGWSKDTLLPLLVAHGITTVRDMGGDLAALKEWRQQIEAGSLLGPRLYFCGPMLDGGEAEPPALRAIASPNEGRRAVRELTASGADFIKVLSRLDRESYLAIADETKKQGLALVGHVPNVLSARQASEAGQRSIEHIFYSNLTFDCSSRETALRRQAAEARARRDVSGAAAARDAANASYDAQKAEALWRTLLQNKTWVVPTLVAMQTIARQRELAQSAPAELAYLPPALRAKWSPNEIRKQISPEVGQWYAAKYQNDLKLARSMHEAGVPLLAGSDSLDPLNFPGPSLHQELKLLTEIGLTPTEALQAATSKPAQFLGADGEGGWGTIQPGRVADLVLLQADPRKDIANSQRIAAVVLRGQYLNREKLDEILRQARAAAAADE